jgi:hypothetical protein
MFQLRQLTTACAAVALTAAAAIPATAGPASDAQTPQRLAQAEAPAEFPDDLLVAYARTAVELSRIRNDYVAAVRTVETEQERSQLVEQATTEMTDAVRREPGMTVENFNAISVAAEQDPTLARKIDDYIAQTLE